MSKKLLTSLGSLLFVAVMGVLVVKKYQGIFSLNRAQSIMSVVLLAVVAVAVSPISEGLGKYLPWKESVLQWISVALLIILAAPIFIFFIL